MFDFQDLAKKTVELHDKREAMQKASRERFTSHPAAYVLATLIKHETNLEEAIKDLAQLYDAAYQDGQADLAQILRERMDKEKK